MGKLILYPKVEVKPESFKGRKTVTVPNQSMSLQTILKRFTRRESLPIEKEGFYDDRFGDVEKLQHEDITVRMERADNLKKWVKHSSDNNQRLEQIEIEKIRASKAAEPSKEPDGPK